MFSKSRLVSAVVLLFAAGLIFYLIVTNVSQEDVGIDQGMVAEDFTLPLWGTEETASLSDYRGEIVIMNMWASWCPPCREEMPDLDRLHQDYKDVGVTVLGVNMNKFERTREDADAFLEEFDVSFPTLIDVEGDVASVYQIQGLPMTYIIDEEGVINLVIRGEVNYEGLEEIILEMF